MRRSDLVLSYMARWRRPHIERNHSLFSLSFFSLISPGALDWLNWAISQRARKPIGVVYTSASRPESRAGVKDTRSGETKRRCPAQMEPKRVESSLHWGCPLWGQTSGWHQIDHPHMPIFLLNEIFTTVYEEMNWAIFCSLPRKENLLPTTLI